MMTFYINQYRGHSGLEFKAVHFDRAESDDQAAVNLFLLSWQRIGVWRVRPKTQAAFQNLHFRACMAHAK